MGVSDMGPHLSKYGNIYGLDQLSKYLVWEEYMEYSCTSRLPYTPATPAPAWAQAWAPAAATAAAAARQVCTTAPRQANTGTGTITGTGTGTGAAEAFNNRGKRNKRDGLLM